jgi:signal peptidase II
MQRLTRLFVVITLLFACAGCDQATKSLARTHLSPGVTSSYAHDMFRLVYSENAGAFLSLGASLPKAVRTMVLQGAVGLIAVGLVAAALFWRGLTELQVAAITLLGASGFGNLIDRVVYDGRVTDFLNLGLGHLRTGIFNIADVYGVVGVIMLLAFGFGGRK